jgi:hypothetical protein
MTGERAYLIRIKDDLFDIASRLKEIDGRYFLVYNKKYGRFEVHAEGMRDSLSCVLPFDRPDARTIRYVRETRAEYAAKLAAEIEKNNEKIVSSKEKKLEDEMKGKAASLVGYLEKGGTEVPEYGEI